ncbi:hypothetical protein ACU686_03700 [Yinghuangia aomiensis]
MHGSGDNITPYRDRANVFIVYNSVKNTPSRPARRAQPRPAHIASRDFTPVP